MPRSQLFVGRLPNDIREKELQEIFERYGLLARCDIMSSGSNKTSAYAFVDYKDKRNAEDAIKYENRRKISGQNIVVEWARGHNTSKFQPRGDCFRCHRPGHWSRECPELERDRHYRRRRSRSRSYERPRRRHPRSRSRSRDRRSRSADRYDQRRHNRSRSRDRKNSRSTSKPRRKDSKSRSRSSHNSRNASKTRHDNSKSKSRSPRHSRSISKSPHEGTKSRSPSAHKSRSNSRSNMKEMPKSYSKSKSRSVSRSLSRSRKESPTKENNHDDAKSSNRRHRDDLKDVSPDRSRSLSP